MWIFNTKFKISYSSISDLVGGYKLNDIKIKQNKKGSIKTIDKRLLNKQKIKENIIEIKDKKEKNNYLILNI